MFRKTQVFTSVLLVTAAFMIGGTMSARAACTAGTPQVIIFHAGSLSTALKAVETQYTADTGMRVNTLNEGSSNMTSDGFPDTIKYGIVYSVHDGNSYKINEGAR